MSRLAARDDPGTSAFDLSLRLFGREVTERLIDPVLRLVTGSGAREASSLSLLGAFAAWSSPLVNLEGGLAAVTDGAAAELSDLRCGVTVTGVEEHAHGVRVTSSDGVVE